MPKKPSAARQSRSSRVVSPRQASGLIANEQTLTRSARTKSALDNRSHRTQRRRAELRDAENGGTTVSETFQQKLVFSGVLCVSALFSASLRQAVPVVS
jgi:hypothetical protein